MTRLFLAVVLALLATLARAETLQVSIASSQVVDEFATIQVYVDDLDNPTFIPGGADGQSVTVSIGGISGALVKGSRSQPSAKPPCCYPIWLGTIDLTSLASGDYPIVATATNSSGQTFTASGVVTLDRLPRIQVQKPAWSAVTRRPMEVSATCTDDYGCVSLTLELSGSVMLAGVDKIEGLVDISAGGSSPQLRAVDTRGQVTVTALRVFVEESPHLRAVATVPGELLDADATRLLYRDQANRLFIRDRATAADTLAHPAAGTISGLLTAAGAVISMGPGSFPTTLKSLENGTLIVLPGVGNFTANSRYIAWGLTPGPLYWRDVAAGETRQIAAEFAVDILPNSIASNGAIAFWEGAFGPFTLVLYDPGASPSRRVVMPANACTGSRPLTDGATVAFFHAACGSTKTLYSWKDGVVRTLVAGQEGFSYDVSDGMIAAARLVGLSTQAWRFNSSGPFDTLTGLPSSSDGGVERAHANGDITLLANGRWLSRPPETEVRPVGSAAGRAVVIGGALHVVLGNTLLVYDRAIPKVSATSLVYGAASMGMPSPPKTITLTNDSTSPVMVQSVTGTGPFVLSHDCASLAPGQSCTVQVRFAAPVGPGAFGTAVNLVGIIDVVSTDATNPIRIALAGPAYKSFVPHFYQSILGRDADGNGYNFWQGEASRVVSLGADLNEAWYAMTMAFFRSAEYNATPRTNAAYVTNLYETYFGRAPDSGGLVYWGGQLDAGMPREIALASFMFSPEFVATSRSVFGGGPARAEIDMVMDFYRGLLGRLPDTAGFNNWVQTFRSAQCQGAAAVRAQVETISSAFANGSEYGARARDNVGYVADLYNAFLRRGGDLNGVRFWIDQLNAGRSRDQLRRDFTASAEFEARVQAVMNQGCIP